MASATAPTSRLGRFLNRIESVGNRLPDPLVLFIVLAAFVPVLSALASWSGWQVVHPGDGSEQRAVNLLTPDGIRRMLMEAVPVFTAFPPLGIVLVAMLGIGLAERTGFIGGCMKAFATVVPRKLVAGSVVFAGILSNLATDAGYVVLIPLGAVLFASVGRHPLAGICAGFAGVSGGFSANLVISTLDPLLAGFTEAAAKSFDPDYVVRPTANYYFMIASTFVIAGAGWWVTEKVVEPRLGPWKGEAQAAEKVSAEESRALKLAGLAGLAALVVCALLVVPEGAILRGAENDLKPFYAALIPQLAFIFGAIGLTYGWLSRTVRSGADLSRILGDTMASMGPYIVLAFFAAQFVAWFNWSNLGLMTAVSGANFLKWANVGSFPLIVAIILLSATVNLFVGSASAKWALLSLVLVPMMMSLGYTPELAQAAYRVGDSCTNVITPLMPYFPVVLAYGRKYLPDLQLGTLISHMLPYSIAFMVVWSLLLGVWYFAGWPLGPDAGLLLPKP
jgi:aminobenzoyl-glutamate transport protein